LYIPKVNFLGKIKLVVKNAYVFFNRQSDKHRLKLVHSRDVLSSNMSEDFKPNNMTFSIYLSLRDKKMFNLNMRSI